MLNQLTISELAARLAKREVSARQAMQAARSSQDVPSLLAALRRETALALETLRHRLDR